MYKNTATYTWWDIEDGVGALSTQAVSRWEALGIPKDATGHPVVLKIWRTHVADTTYTIQLGHGGLEVYTAEGAIKISGVPPRVAALATEAAIFDAAADLVGESIAEKLVRGLLPWLLQ